MKKLSIAIIGPIRRPIVPDTLISRNQIVEELATGLTKLGHKITLFATSDSSLPGVEIIGVAPTGINYIQSENKFYTETAYIVHSVSEVLRRQGEFDLIHNHIFPEFLPLLASFQKPVISTLHLLTNESKMALLDVKGDTELVTLSKFSKEKLGIPSTVIYNGVDTNFFSPTPNSTKDYLLFVGRMSKAKDKSGNFLDPKGVKEAILLAQKSREKLKIVGNVEDPQFFEDLIKPNLSNKIEFMGKVSGEPSVDRKALKELYENAKALLYPIDSEETFGLVLVEAQACGTPVIAFDKGPVKELIVDGITGFVVNPNSGVDGLREALSKIDRIDRGNCRKHIEENFTIDKMVKEYEKLYLKLSD